MTSEKTKTLREKIKALGEDAGTINNKDAYVKWVIEWKQTYKEITLAIREMRPLIKQYIWKRRPKDDRTSKKYTQVRRNPYHTPEAKWWITQLSVEATSMLEWRSSEKLRAKERMNKRKAA